MKSLQEDIRSIILASHPIVYIQTDEELEVLKIISEEANEYLLFSYDEIYGIRWLNEKSFKSNKKVFLRVKNQIESLKSDFLETLFFIRDIAQFERTILVILSADTLMKEENPQSQKNVRFIKNLINEIKGEKGENLASDTDNEDSLMLSIFLISDKLLIPSLLEKDMFVFETDYPTRKEIGEILNKFLEKYKLAISAN